MSAATKITRLPSASEAELAVVWWWGVQSWDGVIAKRPRKTEEGCVVVVSVDRRQMSVVVAKVRHTHTHRSPCSMARHRGTPMDAAVDQPGN